MNPGIEDGEGNYAFNSDSFVLISRFVLFLFSLRV